MTTEFLSKPLFSLTVGEFLELQKVKATNEQPEVKQPLVKNDKYVYGIHGLATLFNCSRKTAQRIKNSGTIDKAIKQFGRQIVIDVDLALELNKKR